MGDVGIIKGVHSNKWGEVEKELHRRKPEDLSVKVEGDKIIINPKHGNSIELSRHNGNVIYRCGSRIGSGVDAYLIGAIEGFVE